MQNYLKIPVPQCSKYILDLLNTAIRSSEDWDNKTFISNATFYEESMTFSFSREDDLEPSKEEVSNIYNLINKLGFIYEYNK
tara:strand:+ start:680 stop:925 length:246 start_codon:yes stop_codon:yes gene_type:complete